MHERVGIAITTDEAAPTSPATDISKPYKQKREADRLRIERILRAGA